MHNSFSRLALLVGGAAAAASASDVHALKTDTFKPFIEEHDLVLAEFYAPWCGHCKALAPEYETAATTLTEKKIPLVKVDCTEEADLCQTYGVDGYPTMKVFRGLDNINPYNGPRKSDAIVSYMVKQSLPPVSVLETKAKFDEFKGSDKVVVVGFYGADDKTSSDLFTSIAEAHRDDYLFGASHDASIAKAEGVKVPGVVLYKTFDEGKTVHDGAFEKDAITQFAKVSATPLVGEVGPDTYSNYMAAGLPLAYIFAETAEERETLAKELTPLAKKHKGKVNFATIDASTFGQHAGNLNLEVGKWPAFAIQQTDKNLKFPYDQTKTIGHDDISTFVDEYLTGKVSPSIKSEPLPESNDGPVTVVVAHNYEDVVVNNDKDVLLEFYAPWCGHCKALAPKYEELGAIFANDPALAKLVTIAKVDATANDVPDEIQGFPTIKMFPSGAKDKAIEYKGDRSIEDIVKFIKENGTHKAAGVVPEQPAAAAEEAAEGAAEGIKEKVEQATDSVKSAASEATEAVKEKATGTADEHDEL